jgi:hypothetical protein
MYENSWEAIRARWTRGLIPTWGPLLTVLARPALALVAQGAALLLFRQLRVPTPSVVVRHWWTVYGTLVDFGCLALVAWLIRREGLRLLDLVGFDGSRLGKDVLLGLGIFFLQIG